MVKEMRWDKKLSSFNKHNHIFVKFAVSFLLLGLAFRLFTSDSIRISSPVETPPLAEQKTESPVVSFPIQAPISSVFPANESHTSEDGEEIFHLSIFLVYLKSLMNANVEIRLENQFSLMLCVCVIQTLNLWQLFLCILVG